MVGLYSKLSRYFSSTWRLLPSKYAGTRDEGIFYILWATLLSLFPHQNLKDDNNMGAHYCSNASMMEGGCSYSVCTYIFIHSFIHIARRNVTNVVFSIIRKVSLNWSLKATFANYIQMYYEMLVACAKWKWGKKYLNITNVVFFIVTSNTLDSNQNITTLI